MMVLRKLGVWKGNVIMRLYYLVCHMLGHVSECYVSLFRMKSQQYITILRCGIHNAAVVTRTWETRILFQCQEMLTDNEAKHNRLTSPAPRTVMTVMILGTTTTSANYLLS